MIKMSGTPGSNPPNLCTISPDTRVALEHGASLTSPWQCVEQLVLNSLEAGATSIAVRADLASNNLWLQVVDDGRGLSKEELEVVGKLHWSGSERKGRSLAALRRIAKEVSITSTILRVDRERLGLFLPLPQQPSQNIEPPVPEITKKI